MNVSLPNVLAIDADISGNRIRQISLLGSDLEGNLVRFVRGPLRCLSFKPNGDESDILIVSARKHLRQEDRRVILTDDLSLQMQNLTDSIWLRHPQMNVGGRDFEAEIANVQKSWKGAFTYVREDPSEGGPSLRNPQIGAIHAVHAHWSNSDNPATVVMPTGTGKTDVMISVMVSARLERLIVVVPTDALREQIAARFLTLGILRIAGSRLLSPEASFPIVGLLRKIPATISDVERFFRSCQVVVTTSAIAGRCSREIQAKMAELTSALFIDEAHHAEAPTWKEFKEVFKSRRILQFTATPFREDGQPIAGDLIYKYSLKKAQSEGYFRTIHFCPVLEFDPRERDAAIAREGIEVLRRDRTKKHILMARVDSVKRAQDVFKHYEQYAEFNPVQLHSGIRSKRQRTLAKQGIISGLSRIVICVDMLGEGFDLPELKIVAFHDIRKSPSVTLQLIGRFTRARSDLGDASAIANTADVEVQDELRKLYVREPDWNILLPELSDQLVARQIELKEFLKDFTELPDELPLERVLPALSAVVYRTDATDWKPEGFRKGLPGLSSCAQVHHALNPQKNSLVVVTATQANLPWFDSATLSYWEWQLFVVHWHREMQLLFINCSANAGEYRELAESLVGANASKISGHDVFRVFSGVTRLRLQNVGLTEQLGRNVRYTGRMGSDVEAAISEVQKRSARKTVIAGTGYEDGKAVTVGASRKGRVWSHQRGRLVDLVAWCEKTGRKLLDNTIDPDEILKGTLESRTISERPRLRPTMIDWPEELYMFPETSWQLNLTGTWQPLSEVSIGLNNPTDVGDIEFVLVADSAKTDIKLRNFGDEQEPRFEFVQGGPEKALIRRGDTGDPEALVDFFQHDPPIIWFTDGSSLEGSEFVDLKFRPKPYDRQKILTLDWSDTDIRVESQGEEKNARSIQARVIRELKKVGYDAIVDDDGSGEIADIVAIKVPGGLDNPSGVELEFYHCKYSHGDRPGHRLEDLYELCGQAQKCISWMVSAERQTEVLTHLLSREQRRQRSSNVSRIEAGDQDLLLKIREISRVRPVSGRVFAVQPGLSAQLASDGQLELISVTENYLKETYQIPFVIVGSP